MQIVRAVKAATNQGVVNDYRYWLPPTLATAAFVSAKGDSEAAVRYAQEKRK